MSYLAVRHDGALLLSLDDADGRDLTGLEVVSFVVLDDCDAHLARTTIEDAMFFAAARAVTRLPKIEKKRNEQGLSREEVAKRSGDHGAGCLDGRYIRNVEEIERPLNHYMAMSTPTLNSAFLIAKGLGVPLSKLVEGIEDEVEP